MLMILRGLQQNVFRRASPTTENLHEPGALQFEKVSPDLLDAHLQVRCELGLLGEDSPEARAVPAQQVQEPVRAA